jgi:hypothetical protein
VFRVVHTSAFSTEKFDNEAVRALYGHATSRKKSVIESWYACATREMEGDVDESTVTTVAVTAVTAAADGGPAGEASWRGIDRELRRVARAQAALDAEELRLLALAQEIELHRELGMASMLEYVERVLGHGPKVGHERLRVARELKELPRTRAALERGEVSFSAVRELSRKVTAQTEAEWLAAVRGKCLREVEELLSGRKKGDRPEDPIDPELQVRKITLELTPPTLALFREACRRLEDELGHHLTDDEIMVAMCATVLGGPCSAANGTALSSADADGSTLSGANAHGAELCGADGNEASSPRGAGTVAPAESSPRGAGTVARLAPYQIALTVCPSCDRGWHDAGGRAIAVPDSTVAQAICDAQYIGRTDLVTPERADQEVSPATARLVHRRDRGRCQVPGCRSARWLHIHHIIWREHGGSNDPRNLICLCFAHHQAVHQRRISVTGTAPDGLVFDLSAFTLSAFTPLANVLAVPGSTS